MLRAVLVGLGSMALIALAVLGVRAVTQLETPGFWPFSSPAYATAERVDALAAALERQNERTAALERRIAEQASQQEQLSAANTALSEQTAELAAAQQETQQSFTAAFAEIAGLQANIQALAARPAAPAPSDGPALATLSTRVDALASQLAEADAAIIELTAQLDDIDAQPAQTVALADPADIEQRLRALETVAAARPAQPALAQNNQASASEWRQMQTATGWKHVEGKPAEFRYEDGVIYLRGALHPPFKVNPGKVLRREIIGRLYDVPLPRRRVKTQINTPCIKAPRGRSLLQIDKSGNVMLYSGCLNVQTFDEIYLRVQDP